MVPPPKRQIREDTPLLDLTTKQRNADYSLANYMGQYPSEQRDGEDYGDEVIEVRSKPVVDLKAKMMQAKQKPPSLASNSN